MACSSDVEQKIQHIPVLDDVVLAFGAHLAGFLGALFTLAGEEVGERNRLRADEAPLEVGMNDAGGLRGGVADMDGPGADFLDAGREVGLQTEQLVGRTHQAIESGLVETEVGEEGLLVFVVEIGEFGFDLRAEGDDRRAFCRCMLAQAVEVRIVLEAVLERRCRRTSSA
jgi:hypothetical protein